MFGDRTESNDHEFLRELYGYHDIIRKIYNKDYFYINIENECIIIFFDYERKNDGTRIKGGELIDHKWTTKNDLTHIKISLLYNKLPNNIYNELMKTATDWRHYRCIGNQIIKKDGLSNLSLYDWIYESKYNPIKYN